MASLNGNLPPGSVVPILVGNEDRGPRILNPQPAAPQQVVVSSYAAPKVFNGREGCDVDEWIDNYKVASAANGWDEQKQIARLPLSLEGPARDWYRTTYAAAPPDSMDAFVAAAKETFGRAKPHMFYHNQLITRKQHLDESPVAYAYEKLTLCGKLNPRMSEDEKIMFLIQGLDDNLRVSMYAKEFRTAADLIKSLKAKHEAFLQCGMTAEFQAMQQVRPQNFRPNQRRQRTRAEERHARIQRQLCFLCGSPDHFISSCPLKPSQAAQSSGPRHQGNLNQGGQQQWQ